MANDVSDGAQLRGARVGEFEVGKEVLDKNIKGFVVACSFESFDQRESGNHPGDGGEREAGLSLALHETHSCMTT